MSAGRPDRGCRGAWGGREALAAADAAGPGGGPSGRETAAKGDADRPAGSSGAGAKGPATASPRLLEALVCPASGGVLEYDSARGELVSRAAHLAYPIRDGVPIMLIDEARKLDP